MTYFLSNGVYTVCVLSCILYVCSCVYCMCASITESNLFVNYANGEDLMSPTAGRTVVMSGGDKQIASVLYWLVKVKQYE